MQAKCECGHSFEIPPGREGKAVWCPSCGKQFHAPGGQARDEGLRPAGAEQGAEGLEVNFDWGEGLALEGEEKGAAPAPAQSAVPPAKQAPPPKEATPPAPPPEDASFDWGEGLSLDEGEGAAAPKPAAPPPPPPEEAPAKPAADGIDFDWDAGLKTPGPAPAAEGKPGPAVPPAPAEPEPSVGVEFKDGSKVFDWDSEFSVGDEDKPTVRLGQQPPTPAAPAPPKAAVPPAEPAPPAQRAVRPKAGTPATPAAPGGPARPAAAPKAAKPPPSDADLGFGSDEFKVTAPPSPRADADAPIELAAGQVLGVQAPRKAKAAAAPAAAAPKPPPGGVKICPSCGRVVTEPVDACPDCKASLSGAGKRVGSGAAAWKESLWPSFAWAYPSVILGMGWKVWLMSALIGTFVPIIVVLAGCITCCPPIICGLVLLAWGIQYGSIVGCMYAFMDHASRFGASPMEDRPMRIKEDMLQPFWQVFVSGLVLVVVPVSLAALVAVSMHIVDLEKIQALQQNRDMVGAMRLLLSAAIIIAAALFAAACFPMVVMVLGHTGRVGAAINPVNVFKAMSRAPLEYGALACFYIANQTVALIIAMVVNTAIMGKATGPPDLGSIGETFMRQMAQNLALMVLCTYVAGVAGWRMGIFMYRNPAALEHL